MNVAESKGTSISCFLIHLLSHQLMLISSDNPVHGSAASVAYIDTVSCHRLVVVNSVLQLLHFLLGSVAHLYLNAETFVTAIR